MVTNSWHNARRHKERMKLTEKCENSKTNDMYGTFTEGVNLIKVMCYYRHSIKISTVAHKKQATEER